MADQDLNIDDFMFECDPFDDLAVAANEALLELRHSFRKQGLKRRFERMHTHGHLLLL